MFYSLKFVRPFLASHKKRYLLGFAFAIIENIVTALPTLFIGYLIDDLVNQSLSLEKTGLFLLACGLCLLIAYVSGYIWTVSIYGSRVLGQKYFQDGFMKYSIQQRQIFYEKFSSGDLMSRATMDVDYLTDLTSWGMAILFFSGTKIFIYFFLMVQVGGLSLSLLSLTPFLLLLLLSHFREREVERRWQKRQDAFSSMNDRVLEGVEGIQNIRVYAQEDAFEKEFQKSTQNFTDLSNHLSQLSYTYALTTRLANMLVFILAILLGTQRISSGALSVGAFITFQIYLTNLTNPITNIGQNLNILQNANVSAKRIHEVLSTDDQMEDGQVIIDQVEEVHLDKYSFSYPKSQEWNLKDLTLTFNQGDFIGIVGKTGAGKTTFLRQFLRQYPAGQGLFQINGNNLEDISPDGLSGPIAYVAQEHSFFSGTIRDNVKFSVDQASEEEILRALDFASFDVYDEELKDGLDTLIGENGISLSGGQRQRLSMARAFLKNPDMLILDDSLSAVDALTERKILDKLLLERKGKTSLISSHRLSAVKNADQIYVFADGEIVERGCHEDLMAKKAWYYDQFTHQFREEAQKSRRQERSPLPQQVAKEGGQE